MFPRAGRPRLTCQIRYACSPEHLPPLIPPSTDTASPVTTPPTRDVAGEGGGRPDCGGASWRGGWQVPLPSLGGKEPAGLGPVEPA